MPRAGVDYARFRNFDYGPEDRSNVSLLSPWIRHRLHTESEVLAAVLTEHTPQQAEKFIQEILWRTYWKGWLELRPQVWRDYQRRLEGEFQQLTADEGLRHRYEAAVGGTTGIDCFDSWARELTALGWLHNHARMWFASIWIFTLELPWALGADFFYRHLLDADPASNTLSWRWVGGLQTRGKTYLATSENIARFTQQRFVPGATLATECEPLPFEEHPAISPIGPAEIIVQSGRSHAQHESGVGGLITLEDLTMEHHLASGQIQHLAILEEVEQRSPQSALLGVPAIAEPAAGFQRDALRDAASRAEAHFQIPVTRLKSDELLTWAKSCGLSALVTPQSAKGPIHDSLKKLRAELMASGIELVESRRAWDDQLWPHATKGYFAFKKAYPRVLANLGFSAFK